MRPTPPRTAKLSLALAVLLVGTSCNSNRAFARDEALADREDATPIAVSRTGIPVLMDLPVIGVLFRRTTVVR